MHSYRSAILRQFDFPEETVARLLTGLARDLPEECPDPTRLHLGNELFVQDWIGCCIDAQQRGAVTALRDVLVELNFPIQAGIGGTAEYQSLTLAGGRSLKEIRKTLTLGDPVWHAPDRMKVFMHDSGTGMLPVIHAAAHADFATLVQAIVHRNEPVPVPASMGSSFINGYRNRSRYLRVREALALNLMQPEARDPLLWKDKFLLLTSGPYSGVSSSVMGMDHTPWIARSTEIRLHHESSHYTVRRLFPKMKFGLQDELVADFAGLKGAFGTFRAKDFLEFMGLENFPDCRPGGRMENYARELCRDTPSAHAAGRLLVEAARNLESFFASWSDVRYSVEKLRVLAVLTWLPLETLAGPDSDAVLSGLLTPNPPPLTW